MDSTQFPTLTTKRLVLRELKLSDADNLFMLRSDKRVNIYLDRPETTTITQAVKFINNIIKAESFYWAIASKEDDKLIGTICYWNIDKENATAEIGYELHPMLQGQGIMHEALQVIIAFGFEKLKLQSIEAHVHAENNSSLKVLEKNNFKRDITPRADAGPEIVYSLNLNTNKNIES